MITETKQRAEQAKAKVERLANKFSKVSTDIGLHKTKHFCESCGICGDGSNEKERVTCYDVIIDWANGGE